MSDDRETQGSERDRTPAAALAGQGSDLARLSMNVLAAQNWTVARHLLERARDALDQALDALAELDAAEGRTS